MYTLYFCQTLIICYNHAYQIGMKMQLLVYPLFVISAIIWLQCAFHFMTPSNLYVSDHHEQNLKRCFVTH